MAISILEKINRAGVKLLKPLTPEETFATIINEATKLVKADYGAIYFMVDGELKRVYTTLPEINRIKLRKRGFTYTAFKNRKSIILDMEKVANIHPLLKRLGIKSNVRVPLFYRNKSIGVLGLMSKKEKLFTHKDIEIIELFASIASLAIRKTQFQIETEKAVELQDLFMSMAAHEIRTPLTTISGYVQLLKGKMANSDTAESKWIEEMYLETFRLTKLVQEFLQVGRMKNGQLQYVFEEKQLSDVINRAIKDFKFMYQNRELVFNNAVNSNNDMFVGDFDKMLEVVINVLDNAAKYSDPDTPVIMNLTQTRTSLVLTVQDKGIGIDKQDLKKVFDEFYQSGHKAQGMGLGLFLAKNIVFRHRGTIKIKSQLNEGTVVEIRLPKVVHSKIGLKYNKHRSLQLID